jgi:hypothetical protein
LHEQPPQDDSREVSSVDNSPPELESGDNDKNTGPDSGPN